MPDNPNPPDCIADALYRQLGPIETDHEERRIDELAQAVWDALLAHGNICNDWGQFAHYWRRAGVLVIPIDPGEA